MNATVGWILAVLAVALGYMLWDWQGVLLAISVIVFWLLLQFSRALRAMRAAGSAPVGQVPSALMLHAKLAKGMRLTQILPITRSLGRKVADDPETFTWTDDANVVVRVQFVNGKVSHWELDRSAATRPAPMLD
jgi:hypothetical protein